MSDRVPLSEGNDFAEPMGTALSRTSEDASLLQLRRVSTPSLQATASTRCTKANRTRARGKQSRMKRPPREAAALRRCPRRPGPCHAFHSLVLASRLQHVSQTQHRQIQESAQSSSMSHQRVESVFRRRCQSGEECRDRIGTTELQERSIGGNGDARAPRWALCSATPFYRSS